MSHGPGLYKLFYNTDLLCILNLLHINLKKIIIKIGLNSNNVFKLSKIVLFKMLSIVNLHFYLLQDRFGPSISVTSPDL